MVTDVTSCNLVELCHRLRVKCCFHHQDTLRLHGLRSQKTWIFNSAVIPSNAATAYLTVVTSILKHLAMLWKILWKWRQLCRMLPTYEGSGQDQMSSYCPTYLHIRSYDLLQQTIQDVMYAVKMDHTKVDKKQTQIKRQKYSNWNSWKILTDFCFGKPSYCSYKNINL